MLCTYNTLISTLTSGQTISVLCLKVRGEWNQLFHLFNTIPDCWCRFCPQVLQAYLRPQRFYPFCEALIDEGHIIGADRWSSKVVSWVSTEVWRWCMETVERTTCYSRGLRPETTRKPTTLSRKSYQVSYLCNAKYCEIVLLQKIDKLEAIWYMNIFCIFSVNIIAFKKKFKD